jgi:hypothetical protein
MESKSLYDFICLVPQLPRDDTASSCLRIAHGARQESVLSHLLVLEVTQELVGDDRRVLEVY